MLPERKELGKQTPLTNAALLLQNIPRQCQRADLVFLIKLSPHFLLLFKIYGFCLIYFALTWENWKGKLFKMYILLMWRLHDFSSEYWFLSPRPTRRKTHISFSLHDAFNDMTHGWWTMWWFNQGWSFRLGAHTALRASLSPYLFIYSLFFRFLLRNRGI